MLRKRKNKRYNEQTNDDKDEGGRTYNLRDKMRSDRFEHFKDLQDLSGDSITLKLIQRNGFDKPIIVKTPAGLDLRVPPKGFIVKDVGRLVGHDRLIDVMDVKTQKNIEMSMKDWCKYYESRHRDRLLNVISLEFSHTDLDGLVDSPRIVKLLDWVDLVWPKFLKESQTESTNTIDKMKYPKVQKYCLMSVKGSYTDFHIDFGGTSVWYHILRGKKIFWMCPPTELNLQAFEEWTLSGMQQDVFFGDTVEECFRVELCAGNTFFIPSGWIHAVYTLEDSLVFGGNFLHSFGIENQLKVSKIEDATKVPVKFRYPFYTEMLWYVVQHYVYCLTGKSHLHDTPKNSATTTPEKNIRSGNVGCKVENVERTGSDQDESDSKKKRAAVAKKRGKPPKSVSTKKQKKPPTDDESTEIDSDLEDIKPAKNTTTCRMTKNSLQRLQYEVEPQIQADESKKATAVVKSSTNANNLTNKKGDPDELTKNTNSSKKATSTPETVITSKPSQDESKLDLPQLDSKINGWSLSQTSGNQQIWSNRDSEPKEPLKIHITKYELNGLKILVKYLGKLSGAKKNLPTLIRNSRALLDDCKKLIAEHENDDPELAATDVPIGPELLNPKKSDINQLIEQFFKPTDTTANDSTSNLDPSNTWISKSDSSTLTQQQRLKYNQNNLESKEEKKNSTASTETVPSKTSSPRRETKTSSPNKKFLSSPSLASVASATTSTGSSPDQPRPKSPPTRPLSNKQYTSKTTKDNSLVLPGSFADLIAATSAAKEVFEVSSSDVTSTLFGIKSASPNRSTQKTKDTSNSLDARKTQISKSQNNHDNDAQPSTSDTSTSVIKSTKDLAQKNTSPEPPKVAPKRFINPAYKPQTKEKLIFSSAPYVSPVSAADQSKSSRLYPWQSPAPHCTPHNSQQNYQQQSSDHTQPRQQDIPQSSNPTVTPPTSTSVVIRKTPSPIKQEAMQAQARSSEIEVPLKSALLDQNPPSEERQSTRINSDEPRKRHDSTVESTQSKNTTSTEPVKNSISDYALAAGPSQVPLNNRPSLSTDKSLPAISAEGVESSKIKKPHKPRGPPKKSKEARQAIESTSMEPVSSVMPIRAQLPMQLSPQLPVNVSAVPVPVIKLNMSAQPPTVIQSHHTPKLETTEKMPTTSQMKDKSKPKAKRSKKQKDEQDPAPIASQNSTNSNQSKPSVICGLVAPPMSSAQNVATSASKMNQQQYLISRPLLFNSMPTFSSAHMHLLPRASMPIFTNTVPTSLSLPNMQQGARIVWATRPPGMTTAPETVTSSATAPTQPTTSQAKSSTQKKPSASSSASSRQPENAALLSLATTALSTAPLPTTPILSHMSSQVPSMPQALMVNSMLSGHQGLYAGQQFFHPFMQRLPMVQFAPPRAMSPGQIGSAPVRPGVARPTGQLLFAPLPNNNQPRYLITQPGFFPQRPQTTQLYLGHQPPTTMAFAAYQAAPGLNTAKETVKVKKVKTR